MNGFRLKFLLEFPFVAICILLLSACNPDSRQAEPLITTNLPTILPDSPPLPTATIEPSKEPTQTSTQTPEALPTETPTPESTATITLPPPSSDKEILILMEQWLGDAGFVQPDLTGITLPRMILYVDGQLIWKESPNSSLLEAKLNQAQMCELLSAIRETGIFETAGTGELGPDDPLYTGLTWDNYAEGGPGSVVLINGSPSRKIFLLRSNADYLIPEAKAFYDLMDQYRPEGLKLYNAERTLFYLSPGMDLAVFHDLELTPHNWPKEMPKISEILGDKPEAVVELTQPQVELLLPYFKDAKNGIQLFTKGEKTYTGVLRPLLPTETNQFETPGRWEAVEYSLPFACNP
jgi:hypothetical protein